MRKSTAWFLHGSTLLIGGTGLAFAWMLYLAEPADEFALVNHPWQPDVQHLHILTAPLLVFGCGVVWTAHIWRRIRSGYTSRRRTGLSLAILLGPMIVSGYLIQVAVAEWARDLWVVMHVATSCLWLVAYGIHQLSPRSPRVS